MYGGELERRKKKKISLALSLVQQKGECKRKKNENDKKVNEKK
jgi:hypothetical protein